MEASNTDPREAALAAREADLAAREAALRDAENTVAADTNVQEGAGTAGATPPEKRAAPETPEEVRQLAQDFAEYRKEVAALRAELQRHRVPVATVVQASETPEQRAKDRLAAIAENDYYCPACGRLSKYPRECTGPREGFGHAPVESVSTEELAGDPANHTPAPSSDPDFPDRLAA